MARRRLTRTAAGNKWGAGVRWMDVFGGRAIQTGPSLLDPTWAEARGKWISGTAPPIPASTRSPLALKSGV